MPCPFCNAERHPELEGQPWKMEGDYDPTVSFACWRYANPAPIAAAPAAAPGLLEKAASLARASASWAREGFPTRPPEEQAKIQEICKACEKYHAPSGTCTLCGCKLRLKIAMASEHCPISKW